jgi:hypothetical protein
MRAYLKVNDQGQDEQMRQMLGAATELAETIVGTCIPRLITGERIYGTERYSLRLPQAPIMPSTPITIASVWPGGPSWTETILSVNAQIGVIMPLDYIGFWYGPWVATYTAGRLVIPQRVVLAVKEIVFDLWAPLRGNQSDLQDPGMAETSQYDYQLGILPGYQMPPHARALLRSEALPGFA